MNIAVITGASSGLGIEYLKSICEKYPNLHEYWIIARRTEKLNKIANLYPDRKIIPVSLDLSEYESYKKLDEMLAKADADI